MTTRSRKPMNLSVDTFDQYGKPGAEVMGPYPAVLPPPVESPIRDRLNVLRECVDRDGLLHVFVAVAHDAVFVGQHVRVPVTDRVAGLVEIGFLEVELPEFDQR